MKIKVKVIVLTLISYVLLLLHIPAAGSFWRFEDSRPVPSKGSQIRIPDTYEVLVLNEPALSVFLSQLSTDPVDTQLIALPVPGKKMRLFRVWQTSVMEPGLQQKFASIRTFTGFAEDDPSVTVKMDFTDYGFHAMVYDRDATFFIDPFSNIVDGYYMIYYKKDYRRSTEEMMDCTTESIYGHRENIMHNDYYGYASRQNGNTRKTYRMALSCTGEYARAVGGTTPTLSGVLSAMTTTLNRVNGIYERELSVSFTLIENNDMLIYLDPATDPFTANNSGTALLLQNQNNINSVIGSANYDIGHIFSTGGGGIASKGSVCQEDKAMGVTGSLNPVGDPFDVDFVSHEIGHQFNANHTFNRCSQEVMETAYEPGGGTTIMGYAGICGSLNNIQLNSDAYFHAISLYEMSDFILNSATCGTASPGITPPSLPPLGQEYYIPYLTNFELWSPHAYSPNAGMLLYSWEQWNLGDFRSNENGGAYFSGGPSFRSFFYDTSRLRVFPQVDSMIRNRNNVKGERLPAVARDLFFKASVRIVINGYGAFALSEDSLVLHVINSGIPFRVLYPNTVEDILVAGMETQVSWDVADTDLPPVNTPEVDVYLSVDGGYTYPYLLAEQVPNSGTVMVTIPDTLTDEARIKIKGNGNVFFDISNTDIRILDSTQVSITSNTYLEQSVHIFPNPASEVLYFTTSGDRKLQLVLYNACGQQVWKGAMHKNLQLPVQNYAKGIYYMQIRDEETGSATTSKLVLQ